MTRRPWARFPLRGPITDATAEDYATEAELLRVAALGASSTGGLPRWRLCEQAQIFARLARRKAWAEQTVQHRLRSWWGA